MEQNLFCFFLRVEGSNWDQIPLIEVRFVFEGLVWVYYGGWGEGVYVNKSVGPGSCKLPCRYAWSRSEGLFVGFSLPLLPPATSVSVWVRPSRDFVYTGYYCLSMCPAPARLRGFSIPHLVHYTVRATLRYDYALPTTLHGVVSAAQWTAPCLLYAPHLKHNCVV